QGCCRRRDGRVTAEAFRLLFESNGEVLTLYVERMVRSPHVAADLVQDVFLRLWRGRAQLDIRGDVRGYLRRMARNRALDWLRREQLRVQWERTAEVEVRAWSESSTDHERFALLSQVLGELLAAMPERRRRVCEMRWNEGLGPAVIAQRLGLSLKTVETHITRALKDVRAEVAQRQLVS
ncbi:MAG TPA: sigma-70 family RNA polymerase sigma factor, partial [Gemmatimonadaceae bacterium]|nr:sigma-70 family RNA polymerase sigma factor [Gemmatimonadaceae bacterium]